MQNDVEYMRELSHAGLLDSAGSRKPAVHQYGLAEELLASLLVTLQSALRGEGDPRPTPVTPRTAHDVLDAETADADEAAIMAACVEVSDEDYLAWAGQSA